MGKQLPPANYASLELFFGHLHLIVENEAVNKMSVQNLSVCLNHFQPLALQTAVEHYRECFGAAERCRTPDTAGSDRSFATARSDSTFNVEACTLPHFAPSLSDPAPGAADQVVVGEAKS